MAKRGESKHLKRTQVTANIVIPRKKYKFYSRPLPGKHGLERGISMLGLIRDVLKIANNAREAMFLIKNKKISLDGKLVKDGKTITGFGDNVEVCDDSFLIWLDEKGKLIARKIEPINYKLTKIISKRKAEGGKTVFGTSDGRNIISEDDNVQIGDSVKVSFDNKIIERIPLEQGRKIMIFRGKNAGKTGKIIKIERKSALIEGEKKSFFAELESCFAI